jgi:Putative transposase of IS4/5 family (DUF4096)
LRCGPRKRGFPGSLMYHRQLGPHRSIMRHRRVFSVAAFCLFRKFNEIAMSRYNLTDFEWNMIKPLLPNKPRGVPRVDDRRVLNGIFWVLRSGAPWRDLPDCYGPVPPATIGLSDGGGPASGRD